jgi:NADH-quinone oxidoreductase subunit J
MNTAWVKDAILLFFIAWTLCMAMMTVGLPNVFHNALAFVGAMFGVAVLFLFLNCEFMAVVQVLIYIGAVAVVIVFAIMLSPPIYEPEPRRRAAKVIGGLVVALASFGLLSYVVISTQWKPAPDALNDYSVKRVGWLLLQTYALPFEVISVVLLVAIVGAVLIAGRWELLGKSSRRTRGSPR